jgi:hypothetical protein
MTIEEVYTYISGSGNDTRSYRTPYFVTLEENNIMKNGVFWVVTP